MLEPFKSYAFFLLGLRSEVIFFKLEVDKNNKPRSVVFGFHLTILFVIVSNMT